MLKMQQGRTEQETTLQKSCANVTTLQDVEDDRENRKIKVEARYSLRSGMTVI